MAPLRSRITHHNWGENAHGHIEQGVRVHEERYGERERRHAVERGGLERGVGEFLRTEEVDEGAAPPLPPANDVGLAQRGVHHRSCVVRR